MFIRVMPRTTLQREGGVGQKAYAKNESTQRRGNVHKANAKIDSTHTLQH